ncbi:hypothetical protein QTG56_24570 (plasmid) [Rossellomorea sp. AcN35-11]|nr:hypothetical protein [Rossellomorea aquimaris]WJV31810.1 hypothetical protein QTG56_24570 [Rossellomorea sp. AcN35-11]
MEMNIKGLVVNEDDNVKFFIVDLYNNEVVYTVSQLKESMDFYKVEGIEIKNGALSLTKNFPKYKLEGLEKIESIMTILESNMELKKQLAGIDEKAVSLSFSHNNICIIKSFRDADYFTDYDYEEDGYNSAEFTGWDTIPMIVAPHLKGIVSKDKISCGGGEKLWFSVEVYCNEFAKLEEIS